MRAKGISIMSTTLIAEAAVPRNRLRIWDTLSERDQRVCELFVRGSTYQEVARAMYMGEGTPSGILKRTLARYGVSSIGELTEALREEIPELVESWQYESRLSEYFARHYTTLLAYAERKVHRFKLHGMESADMLHDAYLYSRTKRIEYASDDEFVNQMRNQIHDATRREVDRRFTMRCGGNRQRLQTVG